MGARNKIIVADDVSIFRELEARFLAGSGQVFTARSGVETLQLARTEHPAVIVADFALPDFPGDALCKEVRADAALDTTRIIVITSGVDGESRARAIRAGADDVLAKPVDRVSLIAAVSRFLSSPKVRALPRVPISTPVKIIDGMRVHAGRARTLSRGGIFIETDYDGAPGAEVELEFRLPDADFDVSTSARVVWRRDDAPNASAFDDGMGLQFLRMDGETTRSIDAFVKERAPRREPTGG